MHWTVTLRSNAEAVARGSKMDYIGLKRISSEFLGIARQSACDAGSSQSKSEILHGRLYSPTEGARQSKTVGMKLSDLLRVSSFVLPHVLQKRPC